MGEITILVPQKIKRSFEIDNRRSADEILKELERCSTGVIKSSAAKAKNLRSLKALMERYRNLPDARTAAAVKTADKWRDRWEK